MAGIRTKLPEGRSPPHPNSILLGGEITEDEVCKNRGTNRGRGLKFWGDNGVIGVGEPTLEVKTSPGVIYHKITIELS